MKEYKKRVADQILLDKLESSGAVWKFRSKVVPSFSCKWAPCSDVKYPPGHKNEIIKRMQASAVFLPYSLHS